MENRTYMLIALSLILVAGIGIVTAKTIYYNYDCKPMSDGDVAFMNAIAPVQSQYYQDYQAKNPLTDAGKSLMNQIYSVQRDKCMKIINAKT